MEDTLKKVQTFLDEKNGVAEEMLNHMLERHVNLTDVELKKRCQKNRRVNIATTFIGDPETILSFVKRVFLESSKTKYSFGDWLECEEYTHYEFYIPMPDYLSGKGIKKLLDGSFEEVECKWMLFTCSRETEEGNNRKISLDENGNSIIKTINAYPISKEMLRTPKGKKRRFLHLPSSSLSVLNMH